LNLYETPTTPPAGFKFVSEAEFFEAVNKAAADDPMPSVERPEVTVWNFQRFRRDVFGYSWPGWKNPGEREAYAIRA